MRVLLVHNFYREPGGEDVVFASERELLSSRGHAVDIFTRHNDAMAALCPLSALLQTLWSFRSKGALEKKIQEFRPDVVHFHNTFMAVSPSAYYACRRFGIPVVQTLHNFRLLCPAGTLHRRGAPCEACVGMTFPWESLRGACYRDSRVHTAAVALMLALHRLIGTWTKRVDVFVCLSRFARRKFMEAGIPGERIVVKPNFLKEDPCEKRGRGAYVLFAGRLSREKGVDVLLEAWRRLDGIPLKIAGDGPERGRCEDLLQRFRLNSVEMLGRKDRGEIFTLMKEARFLVLPSQWYEGFPMTIVESYACGLPVLGSRLGAVEEIVDAGRTGMHFHAGDPVDLAAKAEWAWNNAEALECMGKNGRGEYERRYTAEANHARLLSIYELALQKGDFCGPPVPARSLETV